MPALNEKQKRFADYYVESGNATESYKRAGYIAKGNAAEVNSNRLLRNDKVKKYIDSILQQKDKERIADQDEVLQYLTSVLRGTIEEECIVVESVGDYMSEARKIKKQVNPKDRNKAAELLAKRYGLLTENVNLSGEVGVQIIDDIK